MTCVPFSVSRFPWKCIFLHCALVFVMTRVSQCYWKTQNLRQKTKLRFAFKSRFIKVAYDFGFLCFRDSVGVP